MSEHRTECLSEMLGTYLLVFLGPTCVIVASLIPSLAALESLTSIDLTFGYIVACASIVRKARAKR
ncbi:MAG TPA: hypothetical protein VEC08_03650 [Nitrososphaerales archaeon]|nr:hypothetical protein [Nitrososphaerales archaeon]